MGKIIFSVSVFWILQQEMRQEKQLSDNMLQDIKYSMRRARQVQWRYNGMLDAMYTAPCTANIESLTPSC